MLSDVKFLNQLFYGDRRFVQEDDDVSLEGHLAMLRFKDAYFKKSGVVTDVDELSDCVYIDGHFFDTSPCPHQLRLNDKVLYLASYRPDLSIEEVLQNDGYSKEDNNIQEGNHVFQTKETIIERVAGREGRMICMTDSNIKLNLDDVDGPLVPIVGDLLEMNCNVVLTAVIGNDQRPSLVKDIKVDTFKTRGRAKVPGTVLEWSGRDGLCCGGVYFDQSSLQPGIVPKVGDEVMMNIIESDQGDRVYRATELLLMPKIHQNRITRVDEEETEQLERDMGLEITKHLSFCCELYDNFEKRIEITNKSDQIHVIEEITLLGQSRCPQIFMKSSLPTFYVLFPGKTLGFSLICHPRYLGRSEDHLIILIDGLQFKRDIDINAYHRELEIDDNTESTNNSINIKYSKMKEVRRKSSNPPNNRPARIELFPIPETMWNCVLGDSEDTCSTVNDIEITTRLGDRYPYLNQDLNLNNYESKLHSLLFLEEINELINLRAFDIPKAQLNIGVKYLGLDVKYLPKRRPSLVLNDRVVVKEATCDWAPKYEGIIHKIRRNHIYMKFNRAFHESYTGFDVSVEFYFNRTTYRRKHNAIDSALYQLGPEILFPSRLMTRPPLIPPETLNSIEWYNDILNERQKDAVSNILLGECRPKPYCICGPPKTGKTVSLVEAILQILSYIPHCKLLVAAPSDSAANLIAERLLDYIEYDFVRIVEYHYFKSDSIPQMLKPYSVTIEQYRNEREPLLEEIKNNVFLNSQSSFLGRYRVIIGTCSSLADLLSIGVPKDHFTHVIIDEAGQLSEPEILIPLTLINKDHAQIILAGDPIQLGPIVRSPFAKNFGLDNSYLSRILKTLPYQKDFSAFENGFNDKLVTKLNDNYSSLKEVLTLPSQMFYDGTVVERFRRNQPWIEKVIDAVSTTLFCNIPKPEGIYMCGIRGCSVSSEDGASWYNRQEALMVAFNVIRLYEKRVASHNIGIISPYQAQVNYLLRLFNFTEITLPKIGTIEEFQGEEKPLIIISTVRSCEESPNNINSSLGLVMDPRILNAALTRAQAAVIIFGDPHLLCTNPLWSRVVKHAVEKGTYVGCNLPDLN